MKSPLSRPHRKFRSSKFRRNCLVESLESRQLLTTYTGTGGAIADNTTTDFALSVADSVQIGDLDVQLNIQHSRDADLDVYLVSPDGTRVELFTDVGGGGDNFSGTLLDDEAGTAITSGSAPFVGSYRPEGSLSSFDGKNAAGTWTLEIDDDRRRQSGQLVDWSLTIDPVGPTGPPTISISDAFSTEGGLGWNFADSLSVSTEDSARWSLGLTSGSDGSIFVSTTDVTSSSNPASGIAKIDPITGNVDRDFVTLGSAGLLQAKEITAHNGWIYVANKGTNEILRFDEVTGAPDPLGPFVSSGSGGLDTPRGLAFDSNGDLFVSSKGSDQILKFNGSNGSFEAVFASSVTGGTGPRDIQFGSSGTLYVGSPDSVLLYDDTATIVGVISLPGNQPIAEGIELSPDENEIYVAQALERRVLEIDIQTSSIIDQFAPDPAIGQFGGVGLDAFGNLLLTSHLGEGEVLRYAPESSAVLDVTLSEPSETAVTVSFDTADIDAVAGSDYSSRQGVLTFEPSQTERAIIVPTINDDTEENSERFVVNLMNPSGALLADDQGEASILDDDAPLTQDAIYVYDIRFESKRGGKDRRAVFQIRSDSNFNGAGDGGDDRAAGVTIQVTFSGRTYTGTTDANGEFKTNWVRNIGSGSHYANAVDLALAGFVWSPLDLDLEDDSDGDGLPDGLLLIA